MTFKKIIVLIGIFSGVIIVLYICFVLPMVIGLIGWKKTLSPSEQKSLVENFGMLIIPEGSRIMNLDYGKGLDWYVDAKLEIPSNKLEDFIKSSRFANELNENRRHLFNVGHRQTWWNPDGCKKFKSAEIRLESGICEKVLIDLDNQDKVIVYISIFST